MPSFASTSLAAAALAGTALAGFDPASKSNVAVYWGQNSYGQGSGGLEQQNLATYCEDSNIDMIPIAFLYVINGSGGAPKINLANTGDKCTTFDGTELLHCPEVAADIKKCQDLGKQVIVSIGGATYSEGGFASEDAAVAGANLVWETFGPKKDGSSALRPFDDAGVDGFDLDFEAAVTNMVPFANKLRELMDAEEKKHLLTAAPQCPYPDAANNEMLNGQVAFDAVMIQFYNNYCGVNSFVAGAETQNNYNFETWDNWAKTVSKNKEVKVLVGVPAGQTGAGSGYLSADALKPVLEYSKKFDSFGGVMMWDASQAYANNGFLAGVKSALGAAAKRALKFFA